MVALLNAWAFATQMQFAAHPTHIGEVQRL